MERVALFSSAFYPSLGGVEELVRQLALEYQRRGMSVVVVTNQWPRDLPMVDSVDGVSVLRYPMRLPLWGGRASFGFRISAARTLRQMLRRIQNFDPQAVHVQCVSANGWYAAQVASHLCLPLVVSTQGERTMDATQIYQRSPVMNRVMLEVVRAADWVTACSSATLNDLRFYALNSSDAFGEGRASVVYNGIGLEAFAESVAYGWRAPYILALGRLVPQKGFGLLIEAFARSGIKGIELIVAGEGEEFGSLKEKIVRLGLAGRVHLIGRADRAKVHALIRGSIGIAVPSLREPMGIVVLEGLAAGKPVLASRVDGIPEVVPAGCGVRLVTPGDVCELAAGIAWLARSQALGPICAHVSHSRRFAWPHIADQYLEIYGACAADRRFLVRPNRLVASNFG